jgi:hypothetical protein
VAVTFQSKWIYVIKGLSDPSNKKREKMKSQVAERVEMKSQVKERVEMNSDAAESGKMTSNTAMDITLGESSDTTFEESKDTTSEKFTKMKALSKAESIMTRAAIEANRRIQRNRIVRKLSEERGDVPGWVLVVLMTTGLVTAIWTIAAPRLSTILKNSLDAMNGIR